MNKIVAVTVAAAVPVSSPSIADETSASESRKGVSARAEEIVDLLRTRYIREGWKLDETAAARTLAFCRHYEEEGSEPDDEREAALEFFGSHGQSLDWVFCGDYRGMICRMANFSERAASLADAELITTADQLIAAATESRRLNTIVDRMDGERLKAPQPAALTFREEDEHLGIPVPRNYQGLRIDSYTVEVSRLRAEKWSVASKTDQDNGDTAFTVRQFTPSPDARARADEIVAAYDQWEAARNKKPRGYRSAARQYKKAERVEARLEQAIHSMSASTIEGMIAKARCAELYFFEGGIHGDFGESIARDLLAMTGANKA